MRDSMTTGIIQELQRIAMEEYGIDTFGFYDEIKNNDSGECVKGGIFNYYEGKWAIAVIDDLPEVDKVIIAAHELAHIHDVQRNWNMNTKLWAETKSPVQILPKEQAAWMISINFLHCVGFNDWDSFMKLVYAGMDSYYQAAGWDTRSNVFADGFYPRLDAKLKEIKRIKAVPGDPSALERSPDR
jgi:hypothetical protein